MLNCAVAGVVPVIRLPDIPSLNGDDVIEFLGKIWRSPGGDQSTIFDIVEYIDLMWEKGSGLLPEWTNRYVRTTSDLFIESFLFLLPSDFSRKEMRKMIRDPRGYFCVVDGLEARYRATEMLITRGIPFQEDPLAFHAFAAHINLGCGNYRQACCSAETAIMVMALPRQTSLKEAMCLLENPADEIFSSALYIILSHQANTLADMLKARRNVF